ncbi:MAG: aspartate aminotransferase family protein [Planctomycetes bacterium]|nr:aspartate aminotransferase family protein [Planctomycetota bacterium]
MKLPAHGLAPDEVRRRLEEVHALDLDWRTGRTYAYVYDAGDDVEALGRDAYARFLFQNALDPTAFPSAMHLENDLVAIAAEHLGGGDETVGTFTSGGTESIMLAVKAARDHARATRPEVTAPEMILPVTAHAAFHKAAEYLGVKVVLTPVDARTFKADVAAVAAAITPQTILLVGSAPSYPHGVVDPIADLGALAADRGLLLHVDACVGGWLLPYYRRLGAAVPDFDLSVPGVTSLSVDLHKYAFAPKGASIVLFRDAGLRRSAYFTCTDWAGYAVVNPAVQSSKSAGPVAAAWAVLHGVGDQGFEDLARRTLEGTRAFVDGVRAIPGLEVLGEPDFCLVAVASREVSVFHVADELNERGWYVQPQLSHPSTPASIHLCLGPKNSGHVERLLVALREAVEAARALPSGHIARAVAAFAQAPGGLAAALPQVLEAAGLGSGELPKRLAPVNELLDALPAALRKELLTDFVGGLFTPRAMATA